MVKCIECLNLQRTVGVYQNQPFPISPPILRLPDDIMDYTCAVVPRRGEVVEGFGGFEGTEQLDGFNPNEERECKNFEPIPKD